MRNRSSGALSVGVVVVVVAALLAIFNQSRTFAQFMGPDYDPGKLDNVQIFLSAIDNDTPSREITLTPEDPAAQELLELLNRQTYDVVYGVGTIGSQVPLAYTVSLTLVMEREEDGYPSAFFYLNGSPEMTIRGLEQGADFSNLIPTYYRADPAFQQEVLDLLLAQPYEEVQEA
ncbi:hypothetical protein [Evtepia sp.]|uniref:hypothetical protein n=1 Tax=Evtepia sp. TaxID=2773933 RepID=UPI003990424B